MQEAFDNVPDATKAKAKVACHFDQSQLNATVSNFHTRLDLLISLTFNSIEIPNTASHTTYT